MAHSAKKKKNITQSNTWSSSTELPVIYLFLQTSQMQFVCWDCEEESNVIYVVGWEFRTENAILLHQGA